MKTEEREVKEEIKNKLAEVKKKIEKATNEWTKIQLKNEESVLEWVLERWEDKNRCHKYG